MLQSNDLFFRDRAPTLLIHLLLWINVVNKHMYYFSFGIFHYVWIIFENLSFYIGVGTFDFCPTKMYIFIFLIFKCYV